LRREFPAHDGGKRSTVATLPGVHRQSRRLDVNRFALNVELLAISADA